MDEEQIEALLVARSEAKKKRAYARADEMAATLQALGVCYIDERGEWYTRAQKEVRVTETCTGLVVHIL